MPAATPVKVLILGSIWPEQAASAASTRVLNIVEGLLAKGFQVTFSADAKENPATEYLRKKGVLCLRLPQNDPAFRAFVADFKPDIAIFDRFTTEEKFGWQIREQHPDCLRILDTIDLHFLRHARSRAHQVGQKAETWSEILAWAEDRPGREIAAIYRCDMSLVVSDFELKLLTEFAHVPPKLLHLYRLTYDPSPSFIPGFHERSGFAMIGSFRHPPNEDSVYWTKSELWPAIRQLDPKAEVYVYGAHSQKKHLDLTDPSMGFYVKGYAKDSCAVMTKIRVNLAPLRFGAGIKGKIADGWWSGTPVVTTAIGAEGMYENLPLGGMTAQTVKDLAKAAVGLYHDQEQWEDFSQKGLHIMAKLYSTEVTLEPFLKRLDWVMANKSEHRLSNFTGEMLWQTGMRATEYFSRWIEIKRSLNSPAKDSVNNA